MYDTKIISIKRLQLWFIFCFDCCTFPLLFLTLIPSLNAFIRAFIQVKIPSSRWKGKHHVTRFLDCFLFVLLILKTDTFALRASLTTERLLGFCHKISYEDDPGVYYLSRSRCGSFPKLVGRRKVWNIYSKTAELKEGN